ncbi:hypothetical protein ACIOG8_19225 [Streptomyces erythrochromogenes]|uniref:hypothetical protein n=1 Tax=Streptomyces erythrochromogenes TaxID=285574 RepID=UPI00380E6ED1
MTISWRPDRAVRRTVLALAAAGLTVIATGAILDTLWLLGIGVWAVIAAMAIELVYRPWPSLSRLR